MHISSSKILVSLQLKKINFRLESQAQEYAETLAAANSRLYHCNLPNCDRHGAGENLASASGSTTAEINATKAW